MSGFGALRNTRDTSAISAAELTGIAKSGTASIADDSYCQSGWIPKNQKAVLTKITSWLRQAELYNGKIPKSTGSGAFAAYVGPSVLTLTAGKQTVTIKPAYAINFRADGHYSINYTAGVLSFTDNIKTIYIKSGGLYDWLKNDKWKSEFKKE